MAARRILIVDDDRQVAEVLRLIVRPFCSEVAIVETLESALAVIYSRDVALVILDLSLPDSKPRDTLGAILKMKAAGVAKVFVVTGSACGDSLVRAIKASGADGATFKTDPEFSNDVIEAASR